jgi:hypothetical protein
MVQADSENSSVDSATQIPFKTASELGCTTNQDWPEGDAVSSLRAPKEIRNRCLALFGCVAVAYGLDRSVATAWIAREHLDGYLTTREAGFLSGDDRETGSVREAIESLWALSWLLKVNPTLDWSELCSSSFIRQFPDPRTATMDSAIDRADECRHVDEVTIAVESAALLHHCHVSTRLAGTVAPGGVPEYAIVARRRALEWATCELDWDEVTLDT